MVELKEIWKRLERFKYPLLILVLGIILMLLPGEKKTAGEIPAEDERLEQILTSTRGVGEARVLLSDSGVVIALISIIERTTNSTTAMTVIITIERMAAALSSSF